MLARIGMLAMHGQPMSAPGSGRFRGRVEHSDGAGGDSNDARITGYRPVVVGGGFELHGGLHSAASTCTRACERQASDFHLRCRGLWGRWTRARRAGTLRNIRSICLLKDCEARAPSLRDPIDSGAPDAKWKWRLSAHLNRLERPPSGGSLTKGAWTGQLAQWSVAELPVPAGSPQSLSAHRGAGGCASASDDAAECGCQVENFLQQWVAILGQPGTGTGGAC